MLQQYLKENFERMKSEAERTDHNLPLEIFSGQVISIADRHLSTQVITRQNTTPEIWVRNERGQERRFVDATVAECRPGHNIIIAIDSSKEAVLAMCNENTGQTWFAPKLSPQQTDGRYFVGLIATVVVLLMLSLLVSLLLFGDSIGTRPWWATAGSNLLPIFAVALGIWITDRARRKHNLQVEAMQDRINATLAGLAAAV